MTNTPTSERPRERCLKSGPECLSLRECLAIIINSGPPGVGCMGLASRILDHPRPWDKTEDEERAFFTAMESTGDAFLNEIPGIGPALRARLWATFELGRRYATFRQNLETRPPKRKAELAEKALFQISPEKRCQPQEWLGFIPIYHSGQIGTLCLIDKGSRTHVNTDPAELFARILALRPKGFYLCHNHPSGSVTPSFQDIDLTHRVDTLAKDLGLRLLGHWIVASSSHHLISND